MRRSTPFTHYNRFIAFQRWNETPIGIPEKRYQKKDPSIGSSQLGQYGAGEAPFIGMFEYAARFSQPVQEPQT